jgi:hypothetical protein
MIGYDQDNETTAKRGRGYADAMVEFLNRAPGLDRSDVRGYRGIRCT